MDLPTLHSLLLRHLLDDVIALPVKDPYHLPRGLMIAIETLERLIAGRP